MHTYVTKLGPLEPDQNGSINNAYYAFGPNGPDVELSTDDAAALKALKARTRGSLRCAPELAAAAKALRLTVVKELPDDVLGMKLALAVLAANAGLLPMDLPPVVLVDLADALAEFMNLEAWSELDVNEALAVSVPKTGALHEAFALGSDGEAFGLTIYDEPGRAIGPVDTSRPLVFMGVTAGDEPAFAAEVVEEFTGVYLVPEVMCVRSGKPGPVDVAQVKLLTATLRAVNAIARLHTELAEGSCEGGDLEVTVSRGPVPALPDDLPSGPYRKWRTRDLEFVDRAFGYLHDHFTMEQAKQLLGQAAGTRKEVSELFPPLVAYEGLIDGKAVARHLLDDPRERFDADERALVEVQLNAHTTIWEIVGVDSGKGLELVDLFSKARCFVSEERGSVGIVPRDALLGRVVQVEGAHLMPVSHHRPLPSTSVHAIVKAARAEQLQPGSWSASCRLLALWEDAVHEADEKAARPSVVKNRDGHEIVMVEQRYWLTKGGAPEVVAALRAMSDVTLEAETKKETRLLFVAADGTVQGGVEMTAKQLTLSTNSRERAAVLSARLAQAFPKLLKPEGRKEKLMPEMKGGDDLIFDTTRADTPGVEAAIQQFVRSWLDESVPALGGQTPREAVKTEAGRDEVHWLLKSFESMEVRGGDQAHAGGAAELRRELGLTDLG